MAAESFTMTFSEGLATLQTSINQMLHSKEFLDVTLVCEDGHIMCHKVILGASSEVFKNIFLKTTRELKIDAVYLTKIKLSDMQKIIQFVYNSEVTVRKDELESFLSISEEFKIKGLSCPNPRDYLHVDSEHEYSKTLIDIEKINTGEEKSDELPGLDHFLLQNPSTPPKTPDKSDSSGFSCEHCSTICSSQKILNRHIRSVHMQKARVQCDICHKPFSRADVMAVHKKKYH